MIQKIFMFDGSVEQISEITNELGVKRFLLVCGTSFERLPIRSNFFGENAKNVPCATFSGFNPNPKYEEILEGIKVFNANNCDSIVAVGGGSAIDTAKCICLWAEADLVKGRKKIPLIAVPTTAGTGSESTQFAVIYKNGEKESLSAPEILPDVAILDEHMLDSLPKKHKQAAFLDALCQAVESIWANAATTESRQYAKEAIELLLNNSEAYLFNSECDTNTQKAVMLGANLAGRAINISRTTAPHAMCYKITSSYGTPHGFAVAYCTVPVWKYMAEVYSEKLSYAFEIINIAFGTKDTIASISRFENMFNRCVYKLPSDIIKEEFISFAESVNRQRLTNNPIIFTQEELSTLYSKIMETHQNT